MYSSSWCEPEVFSWFVVSKHEEKAVVVDYEEVHAGDGNSGFLFCVKRGSSIQELTSVIIALRTGLFFIYN